MTEYFRIEGKNDIKFDEGATGPYTLARGNPPRDMSRTLTRQEVISELGRLPLGIRGHALNRGMSMATFPFNVQATAAAFTDVAMEQALHDLKETLNEGELYIESESARGTQAVLRYKSDGAVQNSYKTIYHGILEDPGARQVLGATVKNHRLEGLGLTLYMEPKWRPTSAIMLGPNEIYCPGFEEDGNADGTADQWTALNAPVLTMESTIVLQGFYSQQVDTNAANEGLYSTVAVAPAAVTTAIAYAWICRPAAGTNITVQVWDSTAGAERGHAHFDTAGWPTATAKDGTNTFKRVAVPVAAGIVPGANHVLRIFSDAATVTTFYVDKAYLKWDTTTIPDEWCDHWLIYNHYDTTESAAHVGHQNYFDVSDLKGTDEARLLIRVEPIQQADLTRAADLILARRSQFTYPGDITSAAGNVRDVHWLEAEDAVLSLWAPAALPRCSGGNHVTNAANISGFAEWSFPRLTPGAMGVSNYSSQVRGRWDVFGVVYANDIVNTQYRLSYSNFIAFGATALWYYNPWVKQKDANTWQLVYLGEIDFDQYLRTGFTAGGAYIHVEYAKDALDTVNLDCIWLLPKEDPESRLHSINLDWLFMSTNYFWTLQRTEDFDGEEKEVYGVSYWITTGELCLQGDVMVGRAQVDQRFYFCCESAVGGSSVRSYEAHGAAHPLQFRVYLNYLPQYQTPLD